MKKILAILVVATTFVAACKKDKTPPTESTVTTAALTNITTNSATAGGTITSNGGAAITASGIVLSRGHSTPTLSDTVMSGTTSTGSFTTTINGLDFNTTYYIRAYATNSVGTGYGNVVTLNTTNDTTKVRFTYMGQQVVYGVINSPTTGKKWMDRNLGATQAATSVNDVAAYGDLFQWGRLADGHQSRTSATTSTKSSNDVPGHGNFIVTSPGTNPYDWRNSQNPNLWQGVNGINNPCPPGWRVPTRAEWDAEGISERNSAFNKLKLPSDGARGTNGAISGIGSYGTYWSSTIDYGSDPTLGVVLFFNASFSFTGEDDRGTGNPVRCIKN